MLEVGGLCGLDKDGNMESQRTGETWEKDSQLREGVDSKTNISPHHCNSDAPLPAKEHGKSHNPQISDLFPTLSKLHFFISDPSYVISADQALQRGDVLTEESGFPTMSEDKPSVANWTTGGTGVNRINDLCVTQPIFLWCHQGKCEGLHTT